MIIEYGIGHDCTVHLVVRVPGGGGWEYLLTTYSHSCCSNPSEWRECLKNSSLMLKVHDLCEIIKLRDDTWSIVCKAYNIDDVVIEQIENNSSEPFVRFADTIHFMYHHNDEWQNLTWYDVLVEVRRVDSDLAKAIEQSKLI